MINSAVIVGTITTSPTKSLSKNGVTTCHFTITCPRPNFHGKSNGADIIPCCAFESTAEFIADNFCQGMWIVVNGRCQNNILTTETGKKKSYFSVLVQSAAFCSNENMFHFTVEKESPEIVENTSFTIEDSY